MDLIVEIGIPIITAVMMVIVGLDLTVEDFRLVARRPVVVGVATLGQWVLLPPAVAVIALFYPMSDTTRIGLAIVACAPGGAISDFYTLLGRGNVALSVSMTALTCALGFFTMPLLLHFAQPLFGQLPMGAPPFGMLAGQLLLMLVVPIGVGMGWRAAKPAWVELHKRQLRVLGFAALALLIALILGSRATDIPHALGQFLVPSLMLTFVSVGVGILLSLSLRLDARDGLAVIIECGVRNLPAATFVSISALGSVDFALLAAIHFLLQVPLFLVLIGVSRRWVRPRAFTAL